MLKYYVITDIMIELYAFSSLAIIGYLITKNRNGAKHQEKPPLPIIRNDTSTCKAQKIPSPPTGGTAFTSIPNPMMKEEDILDDTSFRKVEDDAFARSTKLYDAAIGDAMGNRVIPNNVDLIKPAYKKNSKIISSLSGKEIPVEKFSTNTMPYFKGNLNSIEGLDNPSSVLEAHTGMSKLENLNRGKREVENFGDVNSTQDVFGGKNHDSFYKDRIVGSHLKNNVGPTEPIYVGPGLNDGYSATPSGGFHNMDTNIYMKPPTVDELRVGSNPKVSYEQRKNAGMKTPMRGEFGKLEKNTVETFYENTPDMYMKTTGAYLKDKRRPFTVVKDTVRTETTREHTGIAGATGGAGERHAVRSDWQKTKRQKTPTIGARFASSQGEGRGAEFDYGKSSIMVYDNERDITSERTYEGNITTAVKSAISPLLDVLRFTKKETLVTAPRQFGNMGIQVPEKITVHDPNDVLRTTIKETLIHDTRAGNIKVENKGVVYDPQEVAKTTGRQTLDRINTERNINGTTKGIVYDPNDVARKTVKETTVGLVREGNLDAATRYGKGGHETNEYEVLQTQKGLISDNEHFGNSEHTQTGLGYQTAPKNMPHTQKEFVSDNEHFGIVGAENSKQVSYDIQDTARVNYGKESTLSGRAPTYVQGSKFNNNINVMNKPQNIRKQGVSNTIDKVYTAIPSVDRCSVTQEKSLNTEKLDDRLDDAILAAFRNNPYTKPLNSTY